MDKRVLVVLLTFAVAITPSVSDAEQLRIQWEQQGDGRPHPWLWIGAWYLALLFVLIVLWKHL